MALKDQTFSALPYKERKFESRCHLIGYFENLDQSQALLFLLSSKFFRLQVSGDTLFMKIWINKSTFLLKDERNSFMNLGMLKRSGLKKPSTVLVEDEYWSDILKSLISM